MKEILENLETILTGILNRLEALEHQGHRCRQEVETVGTDIDDISQKIDFFMAHLDGPLTGITGDANNTEHEVKNVPDNRRRKKD